MIYACADLNLNTTSDSSNIVHIPTKNVSYNQTKSRNLKLIIIMNKYKCNTVRLYRVRALLKVSIWHYSYFNNTYFCFSLASASSFSFFFFSSSSLFCWSIKDWRLLSSSAWPLLKFSFLLSSKVKFETGEFISTPECTLPAGVPAGPAPRKPKRFNYQYDGNDNLKYF